MIIKMTRVAVLAIALAVSFFGFAPSAQSDGCIRCGLHDFPDLATCEDNCFDWCLANTGAPACVDCTDCTLTIQGTGRCKCYTTLP